MARRNSLNKVLVVGSLSIDRIFDLSSNITDQINIKSGKLGTQNLMFTALAKQEYFGGTGGNIAYGLSLLGERSILASIAGKEFLDYETHLKNKKIELRIHKDKKMLGAGFLSMSDSKKQQVGIWLPNAYGKHVENISLSKLLRPSDWKDISIAIFAPGTAKSITNNLKEFRNKDQKNTFVILDPGQILLATFTRQLLTEAFKKSDLLILNEVEAKQVRDYFKFTHKEIFDLGISYIIETLGEKGSILHELNRKTKISAVKVKKVIDATGAGDAYRAGLIHGILTRKTIEESMGVGSKMGAICVGFAGPQTYKII